MLEFFLAQAFVFLNAAEIWYLIVTYGSLSTVDLHSYISIEIYIYSPQTEILLTRVDGYT